ncbi:potassium/proton antiporter [Actinocorallia sp. API 0066]|uniref:potassium/proton antiporter n=1 Tax=Actinocorallia sp. API 0066 TaxID=2896846 RepID=UPI001E38126F|nr:potassium/proton antiporter [Actinocorallia sp. API 0066]MCD0447727.1 potassium/proton antiporter [Actinocorallia sp. API 0066]
MGLDEWLAFGAAMVLVAIVAVRLSYRLGLPSLLAYLGLGLLLGEAGPVGIHFDDAQLAQTLGLTALVIILIEGGLTTDWRHMRGGVPAAMSLAVVGTTVSIGIVAASAHYLLGADWRIALLLGAVLAPTDSAAVFSVLRRLPLPPRLAGMLEAESGFNDAPVVILVVMLSTTSHGGSGVGSLLAVLGYELAVGGVVGLLIGWGGAWVLRKVALPASGLYPLAVMSLGFGAYGSAAMLHASGFLACYLAALVLGNSGLPHRPATLGFAEGVAWLAQIGLFIMLGLLASPSELPGQLVFGVVAGLILSFVARPVSVLIATFGFKVSWREKAFLSWAGLRGAVPIIFATVPMTHDIPGSDAMFSAVFIIVVIFTLVQGPTLPFLAKRLRITEEGQPADLGVEAAPLEALKADLLQISIPHGSRLAGVEIFELRLPKGAQITMVLREIVGTGGMPEKHSFVPGDHTVLQGGDSLLVVTTAADRDEAEKRLRAVSRQGKLAGWFGEHGD